MTEERDTIPAPPVPSRSPNQAWKDEVLRVVLYLENKAQSASDEAVKAKHWASTTGKARHRRAHERFEERARAFEDAALQVRSIIE